VKLAVAKSAGSTIEENVGAAQDWPHTEHAEQS
jgi:hypothetical protein